MIGVNSTVIFFWTLWCAMVAFMLILVNTPIILILSLLKWHHNNHVDAYLRHLAHLTLFLWGIRTRFIRSSKIDFKKHYIYVSNHRSYLDVFIAMTGIKSNKKFLGKEEVFHWPIIGMLAKSLGHIPVHRNSDKSRALGFEKLLNTLHEHSSIFLCPEGAIFMNNKLLNTFRNGAFRAAILTNTPIVAMSIIEAGERLPPDKIRVFPGKCTTYMSEPFNTQHLSLEDLDTLRDNVEKEIFQQLEKHYPHKTYPINFNPNEYTNSVYLDTYKKDNAD